MKATWSDWSDQSPQLRAHSQTNGLCQPQCCKWAHCTGKQGRRVRFTKIDVVYTLRATKNKAEELLISGCLAAQPPNCWHMRELILKVFQQLNLSSINLLINGTYSPWEHNCWQESRLSEMGSEAGRDNMEGRTPLVTVHICRIKHGSKSPFPQLPSQKFVHTCHLTGYCPNTSCSGVRAWKWPSQHPEVTHTIGYLSGLDIDTKKGII